MSFSDDELERYARHIVLPQVGGVGQQKLKTARVALVGAGGIGSAALASLAGAGIGRITIIDDDSVQLSDLHRQLIYRTDQSGKPKGEIAALYATAMNPHVVAEPVLDRIHSGNVAELLSGHTLVVDGSDNFATRLTVSDACVRLRIPLISAAAIQFQAQVGLWRGWEADRPCYRCFVGDAFDSDDCDTCAELGVLGALAATAGHFAALMAIKAVVGFGGDAGGCIHLLDGIEPVWRTVRVPKDPMCRACGGLDAAHA